MKKILFAIAVLAMLCMFIAAAAEESIPDYSSIAVGNEITFGNFEQDNNPDNGSEPIEWIVLDVQDGKALLLSKYGLDARPYDPRKNMIGMTWKNCGLRTWLNEEFLNDAFNEKEQSAILLTEVDNSDAQGDGAWKTSGGDDTEDRIFLLSCHELFDLYCISDDIKICALTDYANRSGFGLGDIQPDGRATGMWWLRSPGHKQNCSAYVYDDGSSVGSTSIHEAYVFVRPALWISLQSDI